MNKHLSRRTVLRGIGAGLALPWLEAMGPLASWVHASEKAPSAPNRLLWLYVPNGIAMPNWTPKEDGALRDLPPILQEVKDFAGDINILTGLNSLSAERGGGGDHARAIATYLTGVTPLAMRFRDLSRLWKLFPAWLLPSSLADRGAAGESLFDHDAPARSRQSHRVGQAPTGLIVVAVLKPMSRNLPAYPVA